MQITNTEILSSKIYANTKIPSSKIYVNSQYKTFSLKIYAKEL